MLDELEKNIFCLTDNDSKFGNLAIKLFQVHFEKNEIYRKFCLQLKVTEKSVKTLMDIPFLPISAFRYHCINVGDQTECIFSSSATTSSNVSSHYVANLSLYNKSLFKAFEKFYGSPSQYVILALLPSYLERPNSSLVYMCNKLIEHSNKPESGFYLDNFDSLFEVLASLAYRKQKTILFGVSFALLDFAQLYKLEFPDLIVIETGGMKGRRPEITRLELHEKLSLSFIGSQIHSEYGMTELLSQAYATDGFNFKPPPWMKVFVRDIYDPLSILDYNKFGAINVIDLANIYSCPFIATDDVGILNKDETFEVQGRLDQAELRGCNLMYEANKLI